MTGDAATSSVDVDRPDATDQSVSKEVSVTELYVPEIQSDALRGLDFVKENGLNDSENGFVMTKGKNVELGDHVCQDDKSCLVSRKTTVVVKSLSEAVLDGLVPNCTGEPTSLITEPVENVGNKLCLAQVVVKPYEKVVSFREPVLLQNKVVAATSPLRYVEPEAFVSINEKSLCRERLLLQREENSCLAVCQRLTIGRALQQIPDIEPAAMLVKPPELPKKPPDNVAYDVPEYLQKLYDRCRKSLSRMIGKAMLCLLYILGFLSVMLVGTFDFRLCVNLKHHDDSVKRAVSSLALRRTVPHRLLRPPARPPEPPARPSEPPDRSPEPPDRPPEPPDRPLKPPPANQEEMQEVSHTAAPRKQHLHGL